MERNSYDRIGRNNMMNEAAKALSHENKKKRGQRVTLTNASAGTKGEEGDPLRRMEKLGEEMRFISHRVQVALKPKAKSI